MPLDQQSMDLEESPKFRNFDWGKARKFYYVAKCGSFTNAGRFLNISQSALSRQIILLEQHLGWPLFARHSGGVKLTRKGEELFAIIETTFIGLKGFTRNAHAKMGNGKKRKIRIATTHAITTYILDDLIFAYNETHPHLVFELISEEHCLDVVLNDVDIAIRPYELGVRGMIQEPLFTLEKKLYTSQQYIQQYGEPKTVEELKYHHIVAFGHPEVHPYADINWILRLGMPEGELHEPIFTSTSVECLVKAAKKGLGIIGSYEEMDIIRNSSLKNILPGVKDKKVQWCFLYLEHLKKDNEICELKNYLQTHLNKGV